MDEFTTDPLFNGEITIRQGRFGYRFSIDAILLAAHIEPRCGDRIVDIGTGCGIIPLVLAFRNPDVKIYGVEVQEELAQLALFNISKNHMEGRIEIVLKDVRALTVDSIKEPADLMVSNPPYWRLDSGRKNPNQQRAIARHEIKATLDDIVNAARRLLKVSGRLVMIYPAERMTDLIYRMRSSGIEPKWVRMVHPHRDSPAKLMLVEGVKGAGSDVKIEPPLCIYKNDGSYTDEVEKMYNPD